MDIVELSEADKEKYNQFVAANDSGSFLQSWEWGQWQSALGREAKRFFYKDTSSAGNSLLAALQVIKMPLPFGRYYWYAPYGPAVDLRFKIEDLGFFKKSLEGMFPKALFVRLEPKFAISQSPNHSITKSKNIQPGKTLILDLQKTEEQLLSEMHHKTRYNIRLAQKHGVEIQDEFALTVGKGLYAQEAVELISRTSNRQGYKSQGKDYFERLVSFFAVQNSKSDLRLHIYKALYNKELLASAIIIDFGKTRTYLFGGSSEQNKNLMAPYLLHFQAILDAKAEGLSEYDFWGIETASGHTPGFVRFKMGFGGRERQYAGAYDLAIKPFEYKIYNLLRKINRFL